MDKPSHADIYRLLGEIKAALGEENEDGSGGTGLTGRLMRVEARVLEYDRWRDRIIGGLSALTILLGVLWWLLKERLAELLK